MNNTNQNEDLNSFSLGNMNDFKTNEIDPVMPVEPVIDTLDMDDSSVNSNYDVPPTINQYSAPVFNDIGTVPPINDYNGTNAQYSNENGPKKKKTNKATFVIVIILALVIVASVIYMLLHQGVIKFPLSKKAPVIPKEVSIEMGSEVSTDIKDYAIFNNVDPASCALDVSDITDTHKLNSVYTFIISCNGVRYTGSAKIVDTIAPVVKIKDVTIGLNGEVKPEDFIVSCDDDDKNCTYEFKEPEKVLEHVKEEADYKVSIIVKDTSGNSTEVVGNLRVSSNYAQIYLGCKKELDGYTEKIKLGFVDNEFNKKATREYIFTYDDEEAYNSIKESSKNVDQITIKEITGAPTFNDEEKTVTIEKPVTYEELNTIMNTTLPLSIGELKDLFVKNGYDCGLER